MKRLLLILILSPLGIAAIAQQSELSFTLLKSGATNLNYTNKVREDDSLHVLNYEYLYNGHGIGIGDFNNDGWQDVFISGNTTPNKLFLNKGQFKFEDITKVAGVSGNGTWSTGVSIADVNGDGLQDIYVCHSGKYPEHKLINELFINKGIVGGKPVFTEQAKTYGLDASGTQSTQAAFFDYDRDGDLDMFLLNHSVNTYYALINTKKQRATPDMRYGNRLFRNDKKQDGSMFFKDVTLSSGILNNPLNYGLSVNISDINQDGWPDIYTTSDYSEHDCYYVNNHDGTFTQSLQRSFFHISKFSMGADIADYNNDALPDVFTLDMLPEDNYRQKLLKGADEYDQYHLLLDSGYYKQQMRNMLQLNRGRNEKGDVVFSEIGQLAGVSNTDWSWSGLFADLNADGWKDLVITNGYLRDFTNLDFLKYTMSDAQLEAASKGNLNFKTYALAQKMPSNKLSNYIFLNNKDLTFSDVTKQSGFSIPSVSNAAAYADFDNDGDLDLIIGNNNEPVSLWKNNLTPSSRHWLSVQLKSESLNKFAFGAKVWVYQNGKVQYQELYPVRGYQSSVSPILYFGVAAQPVDSLIVQWPEGGRSALQNVEPDQMLALNDQEAIPQKQSPGKEDQKLFSDAPSSQQISFSHRENDFIDFKVEVLMPYQLSRIGPALATADVNNDGNDDVFIGGAIDQSAALFFQNDDGSFIPSKNQPWDNDKQCEDVNALFFDADNDGDADLYVVSGGNEYMDESVEFQDRLYLNDGKGFFAKTIGALPNMKSNKHAIAAGDIDGDGDLDLFVGGRGKAGFYPLPSRSYVLINNTKDGKVSFTDATKTICSGLELPGMVTVALWSDVNNDKHPDLIIAGDLMPLMIFKNTAGTLVKESIPELESMSGIWSALQITDIDRDGDQDIVAGNIGNNTQFKITKQTPLTIYANDFDRDGNIDPIVCYYIQGKSYPMASRDELLDQIPSLKKKFVKYADYANATLETIFTKEQISASTVLKCTKAESVILLNQGNLKFEIRDLPVQVQFSKANSILADDVDGDNKTDLIVTGNFFSYRTQLGESDASVGMFLKGNGDGSFQSVTPQASGLFVSGDVRSAAHVKSKTGKERLVVVKNNSSPQVINIKP